MNQGFRFFILLVIFSLALNINRVYESSGVQPPQHEVSARKLDKEAEILAKYLQQHNSPLEYHAQDFVDAARQYNLDWRLVPAIAGVESTFGKFIPGGYNGWGWGVYGTQAIYFTSWKEGIYTVSKGLKENYIDRGLTSPYLMNRVYATSPYWGGKVTYFMNDLERFSQRYESAQILSDVYAQNIKISAISGKLTVR